MAQVDDRRSLFPNIFIASSSEGLEIAHALQGLLHEYANVTIWKEGAFGLTSANLESLVKAASDFQFAALILTPDDQVESRGKFFTAPRDNIIFEMGLFMGALGRHRTFLVYCEDHAIKLPSDLAGITAATYRIREGETLTYALASVATKIREAMQNAPSLGKETLALTEVLENRLARSHQRNRILSRLLAQTNIASLNVWPENRSDVAKIADLFVEIEDHNWGDRRFVVFFGQFSTRPVTIYDLFGALAVLDPSKLYLCLENVERCFSAGTIVSVISVRDLFARHTEREYAEAMSLLDAKGMIQQVHENVDDVSKHPEGTRARQVKYAGPIPDNLTRDEIIALVAIMQEIRTAGTEVIASRLSLSPTHIVISCWQSGTQPWMVVTATNTDKSQLLLFADTPLVTIKNKSLVYYGDPTRFPSSEAVPHWHLHQDLCKVGRNPWRWLLHIHSDSINTFAREGDVSFDYGYIIPTVPHIEYGTERMGHLLAEAMIHHNTTAASVRNHGQWFVAKSFDEALQEAVRAHETAIEKLKGPIA